MLKIQLAYCTDHTGADHGIRYFSRTGATVQKTASNNKFSDNVLEVHGKLVEGFYRMDTGSR
jgi:hypothetical protein